MAVAVKRTSWLAFSDFLQFNEFEFFDLPSFPEIVPQSNDKFIDIDDKYMGRLDLLAYDTYGDENLWWVIALANGLDQLPTDMRVGIRLRLPAKSYVDALISKGPVK